MEISDSCDVKFVHKEKVAHLLSAVADGSKITALAEIFQVLSDPTRLKICILLAREELCVCDISALLGISESAVSHQLRLLRSLRLVKYRREGRMAFYSLDDDHVSMLINQGSDHVAEQER